jgi:aspartate/methionine/tyrosine aminotransferase
MWTGRTREIERPPIAAINSIAARLAERGEDLIDLGQAIVGLPPPRSAMNMVERYMASTEIHPYSPDPGTAETRNAIAGFLRTHKGVDGAHPSRVMVTCGANQAFVNTILTITNPGDEVIFFGPNYFDHLFALKLGNCIPVEVKMQLTDKNKFVIDFETLQNAITRRAKCMVVISPGNPTGSLIDTSDMTALCELCHERGLWLISDETYDLLTFSPRGHTCPASLDIHDRIVVLGSFSKTFALAAWRIGYMYGPEDFIEESIKVQDTVVVCAPVPSQMALMGALQDIEVFIEPTLIELKRRMEALLAVLESSRILQPVIPDGGTFVLARIAASLTSFELCKDLVKKTGIVSVPGSAFGRYGEGYVRFSFGNQPVSRILEAGERLHRFEKN